MPDFTAPEYASYVALMREVRLEREFDDGDRYTAPVPVSPVAPDGFEVLVWLDMFRLPRATEQCVWLPQLADWLDMLEAAGVNGIYFERFATHLAGGAEQCFVTTRHTWMGDRPRSGYDRYANTYEEAAARLWMAVTRSA